MNGKYKEFKAHTIPGVGIVFDVGSTVPADGSSGYASGCLFVHTDGGASTSTGGDGSIVQSNKLYSNDGSNTSCLFKKVCLKEVSL